MQAEVLEMSSFLALLAAAALLWFSDSAMRCALSAAQVFVSGVMPALFPMMVISRMLPVQSSIHENRTFLQAAVFSCACGSPASAQRAASLPLSRSKFEKLLCASGLMSPMFFTGTLAQWCQSPALGVKMLLVHWVSAWLAAWLWRPKAIRESQSAPLAASARPTLVQAIGQSAASLLSVCGAMMLFSIIAGMLRQLLTLILPRWTQTHAPVMAVVWALLEIGSGAKAVVDCFAQPPGALLCALYSSGGLSLWLQNLLFVGEKIRPAKLLCMRALHGALAYGIFRLLSFL